MKTLAVENVLERFILSSRLDCLELKKKARKMIFVESKNILETYNWKELINDNTYIGFELFMEALGILQFQNKEPFKKKKIFQNFSFKFQVKMINSNNYFR